MSLALAFLVGALTGGLHLLLFARGLSGLLASEGSGSSRRRWGLVAGGRLAITAALGGAAVVLGGLSPTGVAAGVLVVLWAARAGAWILARDKPASKERSV